MALLEPTKKGRLVRHWPLWTLMVIVVFVVVLVVAVVASVLFVVAGGSWAVYLGHKAAEQPGFCSAMCHIMEESVESWRESSHEGVLCAECHNKPGPRGLLEGAVIAPMKESWLIVTGNYGHKPVVVDIANESCMREHCHKMENLQGKTAFKTVVFNHEQHLEETIDGRKLKCVSCHSQMVAGTHMAVAEQVCFSCHFKESTRDDMSHECRVCHEGSIDIVTYKGMRFDHSSSESEGYTCMDCHSDISHGKGEVTPEKCRACHEEAYPEEKVQDMALMHENHVVAHRARCLHCHQEVGHSIPDAFEVACKNCHMAEDRMYRGLDGRGIAIVPSKKAGPLEMDCTVCHQEDADYLATEESCEMCHEGKKGRTIEDVQQDFQKRFARAKNALVDLRNSLAKRSKPSPKASLIADAALANLELLESDGSKGVHNPQYSKLLASHVGELAKFAKKSIQAPSPPPKKKGSQKPKKEEKKVPHGDLGECSECH